MTSNDLNLNPYTQNYGISNQYYLKMFLIKFWYFSLQKFLWEKICEKFWKNIFLEISKNFAYVRFWPIGFPEFYDF